MCEIVIFNFLLIFSDIFPTVIDMVTALVHSTQIAEPGDRIEEMKRQNMNLIKKLKKVFKICPS